LSGSRLLESNDRSLAKKYPTHTSRIISAQRQGIGMWCIDRTSGTLLQILTMLTMNVLCAKGVCSRTAREMSVLEDFIDRGGKEQ